MALQDKIEIARKSGYSDAEITAFLANTELGSKVAQAREAGYDDAEIVGFLGQRPKRSTAEQIGRQVGLTARAGIEGIAAIPNIVGDVVGLDSTQTVRDWLTKLGLPKPEGEQERIVQDVAGAMTGQGGVAKLGGLMSRTAGPVIRRVGDLLRASPQSQIVAAGGAGGGAGTAREMDLGPAGQVAAGLAGGIVAPAAADLTLTGVGAVGRGLKSFMQPFTGAGREKVAGETLRRLATDPRRAMENLEDPAEFVPGSRPTTAQVAGDEGLLIAERGLASSSPRAGAQIARRSSEQNQARNVLLNEMAKDDAALAAAKGTRLGKATPLYERSFSETVKPPEELVALSKRPAFTEAMKRAQAIADEEGVDLGNPMNTMRGLHYVKLGLDDIISGANKDSSIGKTQQKAIIETQKKLLSIMDGLSPSYKSARASFKELSAPVNQLEALQGVRERVLNTGTDAQTGERIMSAAKFSNVLNKAESRAELQKVLTKDQFSRLEAISKDLERGALSASSGKAAGSNTMQNLTVAHVLGSALGGRHATSPVFKTLTAPLKWISDLSGNEDAVQDLLVDAMLDPALARGLMSKATPQRVESVLFELRQRAIAMGLGGAVGSTLSVTRARESEPPKAPRGRAPNAE